MPSNGPNDSPRWRVNPARSAASRFTATLRGLVRRHADPQCTVARGGVGHGPYAQLARRQHVVGRGNIGQPWRIGPTRQHALDFQQIGAGRQRLGPAVERRIAERELPGGPGHDFVEQQHLVAAPLAARHDRQAGLGEPTLLGLGMQTLFTLVRRKRPLGQGGHEYVGCRHAAGAVGREDANPARLIVRGGQGFRAGNVVDEAGQLLERVFGGPAVNPLRKLLRRSQHFDQLTPSS